MCPSHQCGTLGKYLQWAWFLKLCWSYYSSCSEGRETLQRQDFCFIFSIMIIIHMPLWVQRLWNVKYTTRTVLRDFSFFFLNNVKKERKKKAYKMMTENLWISVFFYCISGLCSYRDCLQYKKERHLLIYLFF